MCRSAAAAQQRLSNGRRPLLLWMVTLPAVVVVVLMISLQHPCDAAPIAEGSPPSTSQLPDVNDEVVARQMHCSACRSASHIMKSHLADALLELLHHAAPDEASRHELMAAAVDGTCEHEQRFVGLLRRMNSQEEKRGGSSTAAVTTAYFHELRDDFRGDLVKAAWITEFWVEECLEVQSRMKPHFLDYAMGVDRAEWCPVCDTPATQPSPKPRYTLSQGKAFLRDEL